MSWFWPFINSLLHLQKKLFRDDLNCTFGLILVCFAHPCMILKYRLSHVALTLPMGKRRFVQSADVRYGPTVLANDIVKRRSQSEELPFSPTSSDTYII